MIALCYARCDEDVRPRATGQTGARRSGHTEDSDGTKRIRDCPARAAAGRSGRTPPPERARPGWSERRAIQERTARSVDEPETPRWLRRMNRAGVLLDTGPLVALLSKNDRNHDRARRMFAGCAPPFRCCEAVVAEACFLMRTVHRAGPAEILALGARGVYRIAI